MTEFYYWEGETLHLLLRVQPKASKDEWAEIQGDRIRLRITAPPLEGKANKHLIRLLAKEFGIAKSGVHIRSGETGRNKHICIEAPLNLPAGIIKKG